MKKRKQIRRFCYNDIHFEPSNPGQLAFMLPETPRIEPYNLQTEFTAIEHIYQGKFSSVLQCKSKADGKEYIIKRINFKEKSKWN